ncbi:hypothetical protein [Vibrio breoganii]|uniref:hypothetical protein n=1 Tax=Vibrio breoganii TaxID=553239 RepID=UPI0021C3FA73|nr:hypothetical protein [Vibrio breoganii]MDN3716565.1 hypothetical protein [Vibrio breoganii]
MLRFFGSLFIVGLINALLTLGVYSGSSHSISTYECANVLCPSEVVETDASYYLGWKEGEWINLFSSSKTVPAYELQLEFFGHNVLHDELRWYNWLLLLWLVCIGVTSAKYSMARDVLEVRLKRTQDELSRKLVELDGLKRVTKEF